MSARTKKVNPLDRLVTKRDLFKVIAAMNEATRALESRIEDLEKARELDAMTPDELERLRPAPFSSDEEYLIAARGEECPGCGVVLGDNAHLCR